MRRVGLALAAALAASSGLALVSTTAQATTDRITRMDIEVTVGADAVASVTQTIDVALAGPGHGVDVWLVTRQRFDATRDRVFSYADVTAASPTGAPTDVGVTRYGSATRLRIGDPSVEVGGQQRYVVTYTVAGLVNPDTAPSGLDQIDWNVIGTDWQIPISNLALTIRGPQDVAQTACQSGPHLAEECTSHQGGAAALFAQNELSPGQPWAVTSGWPAGTFPGATTELAELPDAEQVNVLTEFDTLIDLGADGRARVIETVTVAGPLKNRGLASTFGIRGPWDADHDRRWSYHDFAVTTTAGAPVDFTVVEADDTWTIVLAQPRQDFPGATFVLSYTVDAAVARHQDGSGADRLDWPVATERWQADLRAVTVTIRGPAAPDATSCSVVPSRAPCAPVEAAGPVVSFRADDLSAFRADQLVVSATWPSGTFDAGQPATILLNPTPWELRDGAPGAIGAGLACLGALGLLALLYRSGRDKQWAIAPGEIPDPGQAVRVIRRAVRRAPVRSSPPQVPPRLAGALVRGHPDSADVTATLVELAVAGHLRIESVSTRTAQVRVIGTGPAGLDPVQAGVCDLLWTSRATDASPSPKTLATTVASIKHYQRLEWAQQPWFEREPRSVVNRWRARARQIALWGFVGATTAGFLLRDQAPGLGWYAAAFLVLGLGMALLAGQMPVHTPLGSALLVQALGFQKYLATAQADHLDWDEGQDIFAEYLPYAIALGCAEHWTGLFDQLAARGAPVAAPTWLDTPDSAGGPDLTAAITRLDAAIRRASSP